jgi:serine/threonine protein kinase
MSTSPAAPSPATPTLEQIGKGVVSIGLMTGEELKAWFTGLPAGSRPRDGQSFAQALVDGGKLTKYQSQVLLQGKAAALLFGNYVLETQLGVGASGAVFKGRHKLSGRNVAIKVLNAAMSKDETAVKRFRREVEASGRLVHPNIVRSIDGGELNGQHYLVMEFVDGADLSSIVKTKGPLSPEKAMDCIRQAASALQYAHEQGVIHRDIKPGNLLCDTSGVVRLLDLGLVRFEDGGDGLTGTQQVMGTIDYMSPEQAADTKRADARCDIYSLGCTLWFLLTGKKLYDAKGVVERIMMHRGAPLPQLAKECKAKVPPALDELYRKMVAKKPDDRPQTMAEVVATLDRLLGRETLSDVDAAPATVVEEVSDESFSNLPAAALAKVLPDAGPGEFSGVVVEEHTMSASGPFTIQLDAKPAKKAKAAATTKSSPSADAEAAPGKKLDKRIVYGGAGVAVVAVVSVVVWLLMR